MTDSVTIPRWAWRWTIVSGVLFMAALAMLTLALPVAAIICGLIGLVIGCTTQVALGYRNGSSTRDRNSERATSEKGRQHG